MVSIANKTHFFSRNSAGKQPLDVREIGAAFLAGADLVTRARRFRDERLGRIVALETPVPVARFNDALWIVHLIPVAAGDAQLGVRTLQDMKPPWQETGWNSRFNLDGFLAYSGAAFVRAGFSERGH